MEKVSIIVPCYNGEKFIDRCIESIYQQSYASIELIVVDDGSTDNSKEKILAWDSRFAEKGYDLNYFYKENGGLGSAINAGLKLVTGDYISLLDADDEYLPGSVEERVKYLQENPDVDVVRTNGWIVREDTKFLFIRDEAEKKIKDVFLALLRGETNNWAGSYMVRSKPMFDFYPDREIYQSRYGQNLQFLLPLIYGKKCGFIDKPHMNYIQIGASLSRTDDAEVAQKKDLENAAGYKDIRLHMVKIIISDENERKYYVKKIEGAYWKGIINLAVMYKNTGLLQDAYSNMLKYEKLSIDDKILYYSLISPKKVIPYKIIRKIKYVLKEIV